MKIPITEGTKGLLSSVLSRTGGLILYQQLLNASQNFEKRFENDRVPESHRIGAKCSIVSTDGAYSFTLERLALGEWALCSLSTIKDNGGV